MLLLWGWSLAALISASLSEQEAGRFALRTIVFFGLLETTLGITQYALQHSLGLWLIGEPIANAETLGVAKVVVSGIKQLRPFGTFSHANVFGGFLAASVLALLSQKDALTRLYDKFALGVILFGVLLSYSRSAWVATALVCAAYLVKLGWRSMAVPLLATLLAAALFFPPLFSRLEISQNQQQLDVRSVSMGFALDRISEFPLGSGVRQFVPDMLSAHIELPEFYYQPVHNVPLLLAVELGFLGLLMAMVAAVIAIRRYRGRSIVFALLVILLLGSFDHYLATLPQGLAVLGALLIIGIVPRGTTTQSDQKLLPDSLQH